MFSRIGKKIKIVATVLFYILAVASVIGGFYVIFNFGSLLGTGNAILLGILIALLGCLTAWISALLVYGYGELVDNSAIIKDMLQGGAPAPQQEKRPSAFNGLAKAISSARGGQQSPQPVQPQEAQGVYQPPQTTPAYGQTRQSGAYGQANPYQRAGSYPPSQQQPASLTGKSGWTQVDAQNIQCPSCRYVLPAVQAKRYGCCPQCRMPFNP
ncbi:MAG: hypothetical protein IKH57_22660 [Clostridia bacterium]|nr:hypothetical protein [Clostridia bacterium]